MDKNIIPYKQRGETCAIACMMMVLEYYKIIDKANWYDERRYYKIYGSRYMSGTPFSALAFHFSKNGLDTKLYHEDYELFNNDKKAIDENIYNLALAEYKQMIKRAVQKGTKVMSGIKINAKLIRNELENGNLIILAGEINECYHAILISGYNGDDFIVCDPLFKTKQIRTEEQLSKFMDTSIGKWFISVNNNSKEFDKNMDANTLTTEENETNEKLSINIIINNKTYKATLYNNETVKELITHFPLTLNMSDLNSNELYHYLDFNLTTKSYNPGKINAGDIKLYGNNCIVIFYENFNTSYSYTDLGTVDNTNDFLDELGNEEVTISFELNQ